MESNDKLMEIDIKNDTCYYFDDIIKVEDFDPDNILIGKKQHKNISVCNVSYRTYDGSKYLVLLGSEKYNSIYNRIRYVICVKSSITYIISHNYAKIKVNL